METEKYSDFRQIRNNTLFDHHEDCNYRMTIWKIVSDATVRKVLLQELINHTSYPEAFYCFTVGQVSFQDGHTPLCTQEQSNKIICMQTQETDEDNDVIHPVVQEEYHGNADFVTGLTRKTDEFKQCIKDEEFKVKKELQTMQGYLKGINNLEGKDESEKLIKLNDLITLWNKNKARKHVEPFDASIYELQNAEESKKTTATDLELLQQMYELLLGDLEDCTPDFIQAVYVDQSSKLLIVDVEWESKTTAVAFLRKLSGYDKYKKYVKIVESNPGQSLALHYHCRHHFIGSGSRIFATEGTQGDLDRLLNDPSVKSLSDVVSHDAIKSGREGTLTCISKQNADFYAMTAYHVLNEKGTSGNCKHIISEVTYQSDELNLADVIHLSSSYFGKQGITRERQAVDVALMRLSQKWLDTGSLKEVDILTRRHVEALFPNKRNILFEKVKKYGAVTGITCGEILNDEISYKILPNCLGKMFVVKCEENKDFAKEGDSGALVTINIEGHGGDFQEYALGIVSQRKDALGVKNAILCVRLEDCLRALEKIDQRLQHPEMKFYKGNLKPNFVICNKREPHLGDQRILVYRK